MDVAIRLGIGRPDTPLASEPAGGHKTKVGHRRSPRQYRRHAVLGQQHRGRSDRCHRHQHKELSAGVFVHLRTRH